MGRRGIGEGASTALSTTTAIVPISARDNCRLGVLIGQLTSIAGGAASVTAHLAADATGDHAISPQETITIITGEGTATDGGFSTDLDILWTSPSWGTAGTVYAVLTLDAGTATCVPAITWGAE